jgi:hypothetical protein
MQVPLERTNDMQLNCNTDIRATAGGAGMRVPLHELHEEEPFDVLVEYDNGELPVVFPALEDGEGGYQWDQLAWDNTTISVVRSTGDVEEVQ